MSVLCPMFVTEELAHAFKSLPLRLFGDGWEGVVQKAWLHPQPPMDLPPRAAVSAASLPAALDSRQSVGTGPSCAEATTVVSAPGCAEAEASSADSHPEMQSTEAAEAQAASAMCSIEGDASEVSVAGAASDDFSPPPADHVDNGSTGATATIGAACLSAGTWQDAAVEAGILPSDATSLVPHVDEKPRPMPACFSDLPGIVRGVDVPLGYRCATTAELLAAYDRLTQVEGVARVVLKPSDGASSGDGIVFDVKREELESYVFDSGSCASGDVVSLEAMMDLAVDALDGVVSPVMHYVGQQECGEAAEQIIHKGCVFGGNRSPAVARYDSAMLRRCDEIAAAFRDSVGLKGFWGLDFLVDAKSGRPALTDVNSGRPNGGQPAKIFASLRCGGARYFRFFKSKAAGTAVGGLEGLLESLRGSGALLSLPAASASTGESIPSGALPFSFVRGSHASMFVVAPTEERLVELEARVEAAISSACASSATSGGGAAGAELVRRVGEGVRSCVALAVA